MPRQTRAAKKIDDKRTRATRAATATTTTRPPAKKIRRTDKRLAPKPKEKRLNSKPEEKRLASKPTLTVVGAGRLGTALAVALERIGYHITALVARERSHARRASRLLSSRPPALDSSELEKIPDSDILIIATPDDRVTETAARLAAALRPDAGARVRRATATRHARKRVALHVSGALSSDSLAPLRARGFAVGSLHPLVSVSDAASGADGLRGAFYCVEGDAAAVRVARRVVRDLGGQSFSVNSTDKVLYHAAAVMAAGHLTALFDVATSMLARCGVKTEVARRALLTLSGSALHNLARAPSNARALTGPFARRDLDTIRKHLDALDVLEDDEAFNLYVMLGRRAIRMSARGAAKEDRKILDELQRALEKREAGVVVTSDDS
jgi:predicted short-subunit dehydrogenase-like oxidoreductase (DUF2520 family)